VALSEKSSGAAEKTGSAQRSVLSRRLRRYALAQAGGIEGAARALQWSFDTARAAENL
jgi:hypothetical protein